MNNFVLKAGLIILLVINSIAVFSQKPIKLTTSEKEGILLMREEEKLPRCVWFFAKNTISDFKNIKQSEAQHQKLIISLMEKYNIADPSLKSRENFIIRNYNNYTIS